MPIQLQKTLLTPENHKLKPGEQFLELLAGAVGPKWRSLSSVLSLTSSEMEEAKKKETQLSQFEFTLQMLRIWARREEATYGYLRHKLKIVTLFEHAYQ